MTSPAPIIPPSPSRAGVLVVSGYGVRISVKGAHLLIEDGIADERRVLRLPRVSPDVKRLVVIGHAGTVSLDALRWLYHVGIAFVQIDNDGTLLTTGCPRALDDVRVRRGQALANVNGVGLSVAKDLIAKKISGQQDVARRLASADALEWLSQAAALVPEVRTVDELRFVESKAAAAYWDAWQDVETHFTPRDRAKVPSHWRTFGARRSLLSKSPRKASNPANALLNYLYAILEAEARIALLRVGLDAGMGVLHVDSARRDSFACDLMEAVRPDVDAYVLNLLHTHTFSRTDFFETADGNCRLMPSVARPLAETAPRWAKRLAPTVERAAATFASGSTVAPSVELPLPTRLPARFRTPLTQRNRSDSRPGAQRARAAELESRCRGCGADLGTLNRTHCDACLDAKRLDAAAEARQALNALRDSGQDKRSSPAVRQKRREQTSHQMRDIAEWEASHGARHDPAEFQRGIAPKLRDVPIRVLVNATGLSVIYCRQLRLGKRVPHPRHWDALRDVARTHGQTIPAHWDTAFYLREIAGRLAQFTPARIAAASGLSVPYCKRLRRGKQLARRQHWTALYKLVTGQQ